MAGRESLRSFSSSFSYGWTYDVFLSFRGKDTRYNFAGNLFNALDEKGIHTFFDDRRFVGGEELTPTLVKAIEESRIAIPVFSTNYASSSFCLDELAKIIEFIKAKGRWVLPIFYGVDPCDVRHQTGSYREALATHAERFKDDIVQKWREALKQAANLAGKHFMFGNNEYEHEFIKKIVKVVSNSINRVPLHVADYPVGLEAPVHHVCSLLDVGLGSDDKVQMVGIHGIGGIGKTTLAMAIYNSIADQFEGLCFLKNVRESSSKHGLEHLQKTLLYEVVGEKDIKLECFEKGIPIIKHRLCQKKILLILDDVGKQKQLQALAGGLDWFGSGSRIIITTRNKDLLARHGIERAYELNGISKEDACKLFERNAFRNKEVDPTFTQIMNRAITYAAHLPLALEVIGSSLCGKEIKEWESALDQYEKIPHKDIQKILKISYDALEEDAQSVFLDIASSFKGFHLTELEETLCAHRDVCPKHAIRVLVDRSLIKINIGEVTLHDLIQDMGREIIRQEGRPGERSRLWFSKDIVQVLEDNKCISVPCKIEIIFLDFHKSKEEVVEWDGEAFKKMENLKTLIIRNAYFSQGPKYLPNSLKVLEWWKYPSHSLPSDFHPKKLAILKLPNSCLMSFPLVSKSVNNNMRVLDFTGNKQITQIPDVSGAPNLEEIRFAYCENLIKIDGSVGFLGKLRMLDVACCGKLRSLPSLKLPSLEVLCFYGCLSLKSFPEILGKMEKITHLLARDTPVKELPYSICNLTRLKSLFLCGTVLLPSSISMMPELTYLQIDRCECLLLPYQDEDVEHVSLMPSSKLRSLRFGACNLSDESLQIILSRFPNVEKLKLSSSNLTFVPEDVEQVSSMLSSNTTHLYIYECSISDGFLRIFLPRFPNVQELDLSGSNFTILPACIKECHFLIRLHLFGCKNLQEIRGIPPNIEVLFANDCTSLSCSGRRMLSNKKLHEKGGRKTFILTGTRIPKWFEDQPSKPWICFWFRNKFPAMSVCVLLKKRFIFPRFANDHQ